MQKKKLVRHNFREAVFGRDNYRCKMCGRPDEKMDAHHITNRKEMPYGGYVKENGISLCEDCHIKAESEYFQPGTYPTFSSEELYKSIGSSHDEAVIASERLNDV